MRIKLGDLRRLIREEIERVPEEEMFYSILNNIAVDNGGKLPVTHESPTENKESILKNGIGGEDRVYLFVGHHHEPRWVESGKGIVIHAWIPMAKLSRVFPDDRFGTDGYYEFMEEYPDVEGGEVGYSGRIPPGDIKDVIQFK